VFRGKEILEIPPNGTGLVALVALNILERFELEKYAPESVERRHLEIEALRLAWIIRNRDVADPDFADVPVDELLSAAMADKLAAQISMDKVIAEPEKAVPMPGSDTVYLSVVDENRMAVSFINSIYHGFGSGIVTPETGIIFQNRGAGFVAVPGHPNCIGPAKRPLHTIIPAMVRENGKVIQSFGVMGGAYQPMGHIAVMVNRFVYGMDPQEALDFARVHFMKTVFWALRNACRTQRSRVCANSDIRSSARKSLMVAARSSQLTRFPVCCAVVQSRARMASRWATDCTPGSPFIKH
jgi:gamma-glutamyltranspeptidase/glutathione hydrolase